MSYGFWTEKSALEISFIYIMEDVVKILLQVLYCIRTQVKRKGSRRKSKMIECIKSSARFTYCMSFAVLQRVRIPGTTGTSY
jgi:hypothetical protein